jgi:hypothetical protein
LHLGLTYSRHILADIPLRMRLVQTCQACRCYKGRRSVFEDTPNNHDRRQVKRGAMSIAATPYRSFFDIDVGSLSVLWTCDFKPVSLPAKEVHRSVFQRNVVHLTVLGASLNFPSPLRRLDFDKKATGRAPHILLRLSDIKSATILAPYDVT